MCERKICARLAMVVLWCGCGLMMDGALWKCFGKALIKVVASLRWENLDLKYLGRMWAILELSWESLRHVSDML